MGTEIAYFGFRYVELTGAHAKCDGRNADGTEGSYGPCA